MGAGHSGRQSLRWDGKWVLGTVFLAFLTVPLYITRLNRGGPAPARTVIGGRGDRAERLLEEKELDKLPLSSIECDSAPWEKRVCRAKNLYVVGDALVFVTRDPHPRPLPELRLFEWAGMGGSRIPLFELLRVMGHREAATLFRALAGERPGTLSGGGTNSRSNDSHSMQRRALLQGEWGAEGGEGKEQQGEERWGGEGWADAGALIRQPQGRRQLSLRGEVQLRQVPNSGAGAWRFASVEAAVATQPFLLQNYGHTMDDASNVFLRFCKYLGRCSYDASALSSQAVLLITPTSLHSKGIPHAVRELLSCHGRLLRVWANASLPAQPRPGQEPLLLLRTTVLGVGDELMHYWMSERAGLIPANASMWKLLVRHLRQCVGLPTDPGPTRPRPNLVIVNRMHNAGRSILGATEILHRLQKTAPPGLEYTPRVVFLEGATLEQQAQMFDNIDILMVAHGSATSNIFFLPHNAVVVGIQVVDEQEHKERGMTNIMPRPPYNTTYLSLRCDDRLEPVMDKFRALKPTKLLPALNDSEVRLLMLYGQRPEAAGVRAKINRKAPNAWVRVMRYLFNVRPDVNVAAAKLLEAVETWHAKKGA